MTTENQGHNEENVKSQVGQTDEPIVLEFRQQCKARKFAQIHVLRVLLNWWLAKDHEEQKFLYHLPNETLREYFQVPPLADPALEVLRRLQAEFQSLLQKGKAVQGIPQAKPKTKRRSQS